MKLTGLRNFLSATVLGCMLCGVVPEAVAASTDAPVKREMRAAWVATVWRLDWPSSVITSTGNSSQIAKQKSELTVMLDSLAANNMNAVNFQVRSRADAFYKSSYEPWSSDLVKTRGMDPGYDPLEFMVAEAHKRGMECHAWLNPYRYESKSNQWDGTPQAYRKDHPDWLLDINGASILNPGKEEVTKRICDIIAEIVTNYDVDGILFDDYFYLQGINDEDAAEYKAYTAAGGKLNVADWRRDNVNRMVAAVNRTIKNIKPWVRFGISPAGIACTQAAVANKYGITPCPTGSDWQYDGIYSDPVAWLADGSLDYISPQIYWTIGYPSADYDKASKWWSQTAAHFGRHFYSSHSISTLTSSSKAPAIDADLGMEYAGGTNGDTFAEYANEVRLNREYTLNDAPGSMFYSVKYMYKVAPKFAHYLHTTVFNTPALVPAMSWLPVSNPGNVSSVVLSGSRLSWKGVSGMRYTVYAFPSSVPTSNFSREPEYLLGTAYSESYTVPSRFLKGYNYAVCVLDRYGNEYSPIFAGSDAEAMKAPALVAPADGATVEKPFDFTWTAVDNAAEYVLEISENAKMSPLAASVTVNTTSCSTTQIPALAVDHKYYWRVRACGNGYTDGVSAIRTVTQQELTILYPADGATDVELAPTVTYSFPERDITLEVCSDADCEKLLFAIEGKGGRASIPSNTLTALTSYYVRARYQHGGQERFSPVSRFVTKAVDVVAPEIVKPIAGGILHCDEHITLKPIAGVKTLSIEVSDRNTFPGRTRYSSSKIDLTTGADEKSASQIRVSSKNLVDGQTYYARAQATFVTASGNQKSDYSPTISFVYSSSDSGVDNVISDADSALKFNGRDIEVSYTGHAVIVAYDVTGRKVATLFSGNCAGAVTLPVTLPAGVYMVTLNGSSGIKIVAAE